MKSIIALLALWLLLPARIAHADAGAVFISTNSRVTERDRSLAMQAAQTRLRAAGWDLADKPFSPREIDGVSTCLHNAVEAWPCVSKIIGPRGIRRVAAVVLKRDATASGTPELVITGRLVLADVALVMVSRRFCEQCTDDTLGALITELTTDLLQQAALESGRTVLSIRSMPQGAIYTVDGVLKSATDALITVVPGHHVVTVERDGYHTETRSVDATEGTTSEVMVTLRHLDAIAGAPAATETPRAPRSRTVPMAVVAAGGLAIAGGAVALALDQGEITRPAGQDQPRTHRNTLALGITSLAVGAVLAGVGGYLWWRAGSAGVGVHGAF